MDRQTGKWIEGDAHLQQSLEDIVTTRKGERVLRRDYGLDQQLVDRPMSIGNIKLWAYVVADALDKSDEPRIELESIQVTRVSRLGELDFTKQLSITPIRQLTQAIKTAINSEFERAGMINDLPDPVIVPITATNVVTTAALIT
ncbi:MAG: GPW/gp25 family protein [Thiotrichaceae bacterium]|nr:GPW/gp25 family protein [Thiotrichaceae bacterium]